MEKDSRRIMERFACTMIVITIMKNIIIIIIILTFPTIGAASMITLRINLDPILGRSTRSLP
jgi:hypothetical protein